MMKMLIFTGALTMGLAVSVGVPKQAAARVDPTNEVIEFCRATAELVPLHNFGECVSYYRTDTHAYAAHICAYVKREGFFEDEEFGYRNMGDCVRELREAFGF